MMKKTWFFAAVVIGWAVLSSISFGYFGGDGTAGNPYQIADANDMLELLGADTGKYDKCFILTEDIDFEGRIFTRAIIAPDNNSGTSDFQGTAFRGTFDGAGHKIRHITINGGSNDYLGLFGYVGSGGQIKNLGVENVNITGCDYVAGLVGYNYYGTIRQCYATGSVNGTYSVGGLVGWAQMGTITTCYATGSISGKDAVGGLVGYNHGTITSSYATGSSSGTNLVGGLAGSNCFSITGCYATGSVNGTYSVGGLVGHNNYGAINQCYATGLVSGPDSDVGGLAGRNYYGYITSCFWDMETTGQAGSSGGRGLTTEQMKTMLIYQNVGWVNKGWVMNDGLDYPRQSWENTSGVPIPLPQAIALAGSGVAGDPYLISTAEEFALLNWHSDIYNKHFRLTANLNMSGLTIYPIGDIASFTGVFDGNGYTISNATIHQPASDYVSVFGDIHNGGQIKNLGIANASITGRNYVGGLAGLNYYGTITACYASGSISGTGYNVGGFVGENYGTLTSCYAMGEVSGISVVGGFVGYNHSGSLISCYATDMVSGGSHIGGLAGTNLGSIIICFWDIQTSGTSDGVGRAHPDPAGAMGKTTSQMKTLLTFTSAAWDFTNETANGTNDVWRMCVDGVDYPRLNWQSVEGDLQCPNGVGAEDLDYFVGQWLLNNCTSDNNYCGGVDMDASGAVNLVDFSIFAQHWLEQI